MGAVTLWRILDGVTADAWTDAVDMTGAQVAVADYCPAAAVKHWYRHRTQLENVFRDPKLEAALRHLPSRYPQVNTAWMWGALLAASIAGATTSVTSCCAATAATAASARMMGVSSLVRVAWGGVGS